MGEMMKVGELARRTGLTIRTLHHYDEIGLLRPGGRSASGHRLYGTAELERLQRIASLKQLGVPLAEIRECLEHPGYSLVHVLELQIGRIDGQIDRQTRLRDQIQTLLDRLRSGAAVSADDLTRTIEGTVRFERYYSPAQLEQLESRRSEVGDARMQRAHDEWVELFADFARAMNAGVEPASTEVQELTGRYDSLVREFTGGDAGIERSLGAMYRAEGGEQLLGAFGMDVPPGLFEYVAAVRKATEEAAG